MELEAQSKQSFINHPSLPLRASQSRITDHRSRFLSRRDAQFPQLGRGSFGLVRSRILANYGAEFPNGGSFLSKFGETEAFPHSRRGCLETLGIIFDNFVVKIQGLLKLILHEGDFAEIKLGI